MLDSEQPVGIFGLKQFGRPDDKYKRMKHNKRMLVLALGALTIGLIAAGQFGCDGSGSGPTLVRTGDYYLSGSVVKDFNADLTTICASLQRNDSALSTALVTYGTDTLVWVDTTHYKFAKGPAVLYEAGPVAMTFADEVLFSQSVMTTIPDTFSITSVIPDRREKLSAESVILSWSGSIGSDGYVIAAVKAREGYLGRGFSQYVETQSTSASFSPEAFMVDNIPTNEIDTGWYYLYLYAYTDATDSSLSALSLPVPLPSQLADSIVVSHFIGRAGTVLVIDHDSMHVIF